MKLHLPKGLLVAVMAVFAATLATTHGSDSISINFYHGDERVTGDQTGSLEGVAGGAWNNVQAGNTSEAVTLNNQSGVTAAKITISNVKTSWYSKIAAGSTLTSVLQYGYIDVPNYEDKVYTVNVDHNYWITDVAVYMSNDTENAKYASVNVNGTSYMRNDETGDVVAGYGEWGNAGSPAGVTEYGNTNSLKITGVVGDLVLKNDYPSRSARATIAGLQVIDRTAEVIHFTTLGTGTTEAANASWELNGTGTAYGDIETEDKYLGVNAAEGGSTLNFEAGDNLAFLGVGTNELTVTSSGTITVQTIYTHDENAVLNLNGSIVANENLLLTGAGTVNVTGAISSSISVNGGNLNVSGANAISGKKLEISNGTVVATAENSGNASIIASNTEITIKDGGMLKLVGHDMLGWGSTSPAKILLKSDNSADDALAKLHFQDTGSTTLASDIEMQGNTLVSGNTINTFGTDFIASGTNNKISIGEIKVRNTLNINVKADGDELLISGNLTSYGNDSQNLIKKGEGTLTLSGTNSYSGGTTVEAGTLIVSAGSSLGTGDVTVNGGNLEVSGQNAITATNLNITNGTVTASYNGNGNSVISHSTTVNVNAGGTLKLTGHDMLGWGTSSAPANIVLKGSDENNVATLDIRDNGSFTGVAPIEMKGNSVLTGNVYTTFNGGNITVSEGSNNKITVTEFRARRNVTLDIAKDAVLTIESVICNGNNNEGTKSLTKSNVGTLEITNTNNTWSGEQLNVTGGTLRLVGAANLPGGVTMSAGTRLETGTGTIGNLTMADGSTLDADTAVSLKGALTINGVVNLDGDIKNALYAGEQTVKLFTGITSLVLNGTTYDSTARVAYNPVDLEEVFAFDELQEDKYQLHYSGGELFATLSVPEPATATLSLLALAGLCARRRRKS